MAIYKKFMSECHIPQQTIKVHQVQVRDLGNQFEVEIPIRQRDIPFLDEKVRVYERVRTFEDGRSVQVYFVKVKSSDYYKFLNSSFL